MKTWNVDKEKLRGTLLSFFEKSLRERSVIVVVPAWSADHEVGTQVLMQVMYLNVHMIRTMNVRNSHVVTKMVDIHRNMIVIDIRAVKKMVKVEIRWKRIMVTWEKMTMRNTFQQKNQKNMMMMKMMR